MSNTKIPSVLWSASQENVITEAEMARARDNIGLGTAVVLKGTATVSALNALTPGDDPSQYTVTTGWQYTMSDSGTLTAGSLVVSSGDKVVWNGSSWEMAGGGGNIAVFDCDDTSTGFDGPTYEELEQARQSGKTIILNAHSGSSSSPDDSVYVMTSYYSGSDQTVTYRFCDADGGRYVSLVCTPQTPESARWYTGSVFDGNISASSNNAVQGSVLSAALKTKANDTAIAPEYSSSNTYTNGELCMREGKLYACTVIGGITTPEAWNSNHWAESQLVNQVAMANIAVIGYNPYMSPPDQTILGSIVTAINERKEVVLYHSTTTYPFYYRYSHSQVDGPTWNKLYYFYSFHDLNQQLLVTDVRDSSDEHVSYTVNSYTNYRYVQPNMIAPLNSTYYAYTPNDLTVDGSVLRRCIEQTVAEEPYDYTKWELTDVDKELKSRAYIIHAKYDAQDNIIGPTREEMDNINLKGAVILDLECYTGGVDPSTGKKWTPELHEKYMMTHYVAEGASTTYSSGSVYYFRCMESWKIDGKDARAIINVPHDDGTAPAPTITINRMPSVDLFEASTSNWPSGSAVSKSMQYGLPKIKYSSGGGSEYYTCVNSGQGTSYFPMVYTNNKGLYYFRQLKLSQYGGTDTWERTYHNLYLDANSAVFGNTQPDGLATHLIYTGANSQLNMLSISSLVNHKMYTIHCTCAYKEFRLRNDSKTLYVYDARVVTSGSTTVSSTGWAWTKYSGSDGDDILLWTSTNTRALTIHIMCDGNNVYITYGY